jgi:hypothetical protein
LAIVGLEIEGEARGEHDSTQEIGAHPYADPGPRGRPEGSVSKADFYRYDNLTIIGIQLLAFALSTGVNKSLEDSHQTYGYGIAIGRHEIRLRESGSEIKQRRKRDDYRGVVATVRS